MVYTTLFSYLYNQGCIKGNMVRFHCLFHAHIHSDLIFKRLLKCFTDIDKVYFTLGLILTKGVQS